MSGGGVPSPRRPPTPRTTRHATVKALLCIMNARDIPECMNSYGRLTIDVAYMTGYTIRELVPVHADLINNTDYDAYINVSDDCIVTQDAVDAVVALLADDHPAATGWCRLRKGSNSVNLSKKPLEGSPPTRDGFDFYTYGEVKRWPEPVVPTHFMGMSLTGMPRDMWKRFAYDCYTVVHERGHGSDANLCTRLRDAGVPMVAARDGYVEHVKERKQDPDKWRGRGATRLIVGEVPQRVTLQTKRVLIESERDESLYTDEQPKLRPRQVA